MKQGSNIAVIGKNKNAVPVQAPIMLKTQNFGDMW